MRALGLALQQDVAAEVGGLLILGAVDALHEAAACHTAARAYLDPLVQLEEAGLVGVLLGVLDQPRDVHVRAYLCHLRCASSQKRAKPDGLLLLRLEVLQAVPVRTSKASDLARPTRATACPGERGARRGCKYRREDALADLRHERLELRLVRHVVLLAVHQVDVGDVHVEA